METIVIITIFLLIIISLFIEVLVVLHRGIVVIAPIIPRTPQTLGHGPKLTYVIIGDSTTIGQGTNYQYSYAQASAQHLAKNRRVTFINLGISGATAKTVVEQQLTKAVSYKPDIVLLGVGANDALHFVSSKTINSSLNTIVHDLHAANPNVKIVATGSPAMDSVPRFPFPIRQIMGLRSRQVNRVFDKVVTRQHLIFAPIAARTRQTFLDHPDYFASDLFHPNQQGYAVWMPVINQALDLAYFSQRTIIS